MIALSVPSYGWNSRGHMMVAAVAYQQLTQRTKDRVDALLLLNPDRVHWFDLIPEGTSAARTKMMIFMIAATWPDRIKSDPDYHSDGFHGGNRPPNDASASQNIGYEDFARHKYWHFIDKPFSPDGTALPPIPTPNAQEMITLFRTVLRSLHTPFLDEWSAKREEAARDRDRLRNHLVSTHQAGRQHETLLTAGQTAGGIKEVLPVADIMRQLVAEAEAALAKAPKPEAR